MMKGISDMTWLVRHEHLCAAGVEAHDFLERVEVGRQDLVFAVFPRHESAATIACRPPGRRITQKTPDRSGNLRDRTYGDAESLALYRSVRIDERHHGNA